jgi:hypothetical protein
MRNGGAWVLRKKCVGEHALRLAVHEGGPEFFHGGRDAARKDGGSPEG